MYSHYLGTVKIFPWLNLPIVITFRKAYADSCVINEVVCFVYLERRMFDFYTLLLYIVNGTQLTGRC